MAVLRVCLSVLLILLLGGAAARAADHPSAEATAGLYDRPVLVVDPDMHTTVIMGATVDKEGIWAVTGSFDKTVRVWSAMDGSLARTIRVPEGPGNIGKVFSVAINPDGTLIAAGGWALFNNLDQQEQFYLFDRATGAMVRAD